MIKNNTPVKIVEKVPEEKEKIPLLDITYYKHGEVIRVRT